LAWKPDVIKHPSEERLPLHSGWGIRPKPTLKCSETAKPIKGPSARLPGTESSLAVVSWGAIAGASNCPDLSRAGRTELVQVKHLAPGWQRSAPEHHYFYSKVGAKTLSSGCS